jgi:uncharacterized protein (TIRG00374 family)
VNLSGLFSTDLKKEKLKTVFSIVRIIIGVGLIIFLLWRLDLNKILADIFGLDTKYLSYGLVVYFLFILVSAWRWQILLDYKKFNIPFIRTSIIYFIALFFNNLLPTTVGGDVMRVLYSMKGRKADALAIVLVDRILGFVGLFIFALFAVLYLFIDKKQTEFLPFMIIGLIVVILLTYIFFSEKVYGSFSPLVRKIRIFRVGQRINHLHEAATDFGGAWGPILFCIIHSIIIQGLLAIGPFLVLRGMGVQNVGLLPFLIYVPIINVVSMIPISLNALGVREYFYVIMFSRVGLAGETSLAVSLVSFFLIFVWSLLGGIMFMLYKKK